MDAWFALEWQRLIVPSGSLLALVIRGTVVYLFLFFVLRAFRRQAGTLGLADLLVLVLLADAAQNGMSDDYASLSEAVVLLATIVFWNYALDALAFHWPWFSRLLQPQALPLVRDGRLQLENMRAQLISRSELMSHLREAGVEQLSAVHLATLEPDGRITVLPSPAPQQSGRQSASV